MVEVKNYLLLLIYDRRRIREVIIFVNVGLFIGIYV